MKVIAKTIYGSRLYGTNLPESDFDYKGIFIPTASEIVAPRIVDTKNFSTGNKHTKNTADDVDEEYFAVHKLMHMLRLGDMVSTELLFANYDNPTPEWEYIQQYRHKLVSRKMTGFVGYAQRQANVYGAKGVRLKEAEKTVKFLKDNFKEGQKLNETDRAIQLIKEFVKDKVHTKVTWIDVKGEPVFHLECCDRKVPLTVQTREAIKIYQRVVDNYGERAKAANSGNGIEWKSMMHAVRISMAAITLLTTGKLVYPLTENEREFLILIRQGGVQLKVIERILEENLTEIEHLVQTSTILPEEPDVDLMNKIVETLYIDQVMKEHSIWNTNITH